MAKKAILDVLESTIGKIREEFGFRKSQCRRLERPDRVELLGIEYCRGKCRTRSSSSRSSESRHALPRQWRSIRLTQD